MKIGVSTFGCDHGRSGIGRYLRSHLQEFQKMGVSPLVFCSPEDRHMVPSSFKTVEVPNTWNGPAQNILLHQTWLPWQARSLDVMFLPAANRRLPFYCPCPTVGTVHDLAVARLKGKYDLLRSHYVSKVLPRWIPKLDHVITVSEASKRDIVELTGMDPQRISVTHLGVDHTRYYPKNRTEELDEYGIQAPFLLYVSRIEHPGKNHCQLIEAFSRLKSELELPHQLVLCGPDWKGAEEVHRLAQSVPHTNDIIFTGFFPEKLLPQLYSQAETLVFPSLYEGFGLPLLEAMACQTPVLCSNRSSLPEVVGGAGLLFEPQQSDSLFHQLRRLVLDPELRSRLAREGRQRSLSYQWSSTASRTLDLLTRVVRRKQKGSSLKNAV